MQERTPPPIVYLAGNAHFDPAWRWKYRFEGAGEAEGTHKASLDHMEMFEQFTFEGLSSFLLPLLDTVNPKMLARMRQRTHEGRWGLSNITWVEPDCNLINDESWYRQIMRGQEAQAKYLGKIGTALKIDDAFGLPHGLPDILEAAGINYLVFKRPGKEERPLPSEAFRWIGPKGGSVIALRVEEIGAWGKDAWSLPRHIAQIINSDTDPRLPKLALYGVSDHGKGPTRKQILSSLMFQHHGAVPQEICQKYRISENEFEVMQRNWNRLLTFVAHPEILKDTSFHFGTVEAFCEALGAANDSWPEWAQKLYYHAVGCYSAQAQGKHLNQEAERALNGAETTCTMAQETVGQAYPHGSLTEAWETVLFNQFHDILPGSSIPAVHVDAAYGVGGAIDSAGQFKLEAAMAMINEIGIPQVEGSNPMVVINVHHWKVRELLQMHIYEYDPDRHILVDSHLDPIPFQDIFPDHHAGNRTAALFDLPPLGYTTPQFISVTPEERAKFQEAWQQEHESRITHPLSHDEWRALLNGSEMEPELTRGFLQKWENLSPSDREIENNILRLTVDPKTGGVYLYDKKLGYQVFTPGMAGGEVVIFKDTTDPNDPEPADTWGHWGTSFQTKDLDLRFFPTRIKRVEDGPVVDTIQVDSTLFRRTVLSEAPLEMTMNQLRLEGVPEAWWKTGKHVVIQEKSYRIEDLDEAMGSVRLVPFTTQWKPTASRLTQSYSLHGNEGYVDVKTKIECKEKHVMVKYVFPYNAGAYREGFVEALGGVEGIAVDGREHPVQRFIGAQFEIPDKQTIDNEKYRRFLSILSPHISSGAVTRKEIQVAVTRTPVFNLHSPYEKLLEREESYQHQGMEPLEFDYRIVPGAFNRQEAGLVRQARAYTQPAEVHNTNGHPGSLPMEYSLMEIDSPHVIAEFIEADRFDRGTLVLLRGTGPIAARDVSVRFMGMHYRCDLVAKSQTILFPNDGSEPRQVQVILREQAESLNPNGHDPQEALSAAYENG